MIHALILALGTTSTADRNVATRQDFEALQKQTPLLIEKSELHRRLGKPSHVSRQVFSQRYREQWIYEAHAGWLLELDCPRKTKPTLLRMLSPVPDRAR